MTRDEAWQQLQLHGESHRRVEVGGQHIASAQTTFHDCPYQRCVAARAALAPGIDYWDPSVPWRPEAYLPWNDPRRLAAPRLPVQGSQP